jgi:hypothetical protein
LNNQHLANNPHYTPANSLLQRQQLLLACHPVTPKSDEHQCPALTTANMLKIWSMKQQQQKNEAASGQTKKKKVTAAQLRVQKGEYLSHTTST